MKLNNEVLKNLESMSDEDLITCMNAANSEFSSRMKKRVYSLTEGTIIKKPDNGGDNYYLIVDIYDEYIANDYYEWKVKYATYFVKDNGEVLFRDLLDYDLEESYKVFDLTDPDVEVIKSNYEPYAYEHGLNSMMVDIFNKSIC